MQMKHPSFMRKHNLHKLHHMISQEGTIGGLVRHANSILILVILVNKWNGILMMELFPWTEIKDS